MRQVKGRPFPQVSTLIVNTLQGKNELRSYHEHVTNSFNCFLTHLHHMTFDALAFWYLQQTPRAMCEIHHRNEFWFFNLIEWLVACNDPFSQELLKCFLIPWSLLKSLSDASTVHERIIFMYTSPGLLIFKCFLNVFRCTFKHFDVFGLSVPIKLFLASCDCDLVRCWGLLPIFEDAIKPIHGLDMDTEIVNKN